MDKKSNGIEKILNLAIEGLSQIQEGHASLDKFLDSLDFELQPRRAVTALLFVYYRRRAVINELIKSHTARVRPRVHRLLSTALAQALYLDRLHPAEVVNAAVALIKKRGGREAGFVNAVMRRCLEAGPESTEAGKSPLAGLPKILQERFVKNFGEEQAAKLAELFQTQTPLTFRVCSEVSQDALDAVSAIPLEPPFETGNCRFYRCDDGKALIHSELLSENKIYIQNPATAIAPALFELQGNERVLDLCAAPGGKALLLAERLGPEGSLVAADRSSKRQELTRENLQRFGYDHQVVTANAFNPPFRSESFDAVLLDVPCSNTGVLHRRPDAAWRFTENSLREVVKLQQDILEAAAPLVAPGGQLVYSTCSIEPEENTLQIADFISKHPEFSIVKQIQIIPENIYDGAGATLLRKAE
jgi:16S rRNA (cytosine967-C5)-methyltransferase